MEQGRRLWDVEQELGMARAGQSELPTRPFEAGMLDHIGWAEAASRIRGALETALRDGIRTADLAPPEDPRNSVGIAPFGEAVMERLPQGRRPA